MPPRPAAPRSLPRSLVLALLVTLPALGGYTCDVKPRAFIVAGQSNALGASSQVTPIGPGTAWRKNGGEIHKQVPLVDPLVFSANPDLEDHSSAWPQFGLSYEPTEVVLIAAAWGNQCLATDVDHPYAGTWDPEQGWLYARALEIWHAAGSPRLVGFLWLQGECEAQYWHERMIAEGQTSEWRYVHSFFHYYAALTNLADHVAEDFGVPVIASPISLALCRWDNVDCDPALFIPSEKRRGVHDATIQAAADHPNILAGPISDDLRMMPDNAHTWDVNALGERWAQAVMAVAPVE